MDQVWKMIFMTALVLGTLACTPRGDAPTGEEIVPKGEVDESSHPESKDTLVKATQLRLGPIRSFIEVSSDVETLNQVDIYPHLAGLRITEVLADEGDFVKKDDRLASLDDAEIALSLKQAKVNLRETGQRVEKAEIARKEANQREATARVKAEQAKSDYEQAITMYEGELISEEEFDTNRLDWEQASSELALAVLAIDQTRLDLELAKSEIERLDIAVKNAEVNLEKTRITAPFDGYITYRCATLGMTVNTGTHLFTLVDRDDLVANLFIPQEDLLKVKQGMNITFLCDAVPGSVFNGSISVINPVVDPSTGTVKLRAMLERGKDRLLRPGMFITARIITASREEALLIPRKSVFYDDEKPTFFLINEECAVRKVHFKPDASTETDLEIAATDPPDDAVRPGALIVIVGQDNLKNGDKVKIVEEIQ